MLLKAQCEALLLLFAMTCAVIAATLAFPQQAISLLVSGGVGLLVAMGSRLRVLDGLGISLIDDQPKLRRLRRYLAVGIALLLGLALLLNY